MTRFILVSSRNLILSYVINKLRYNKVRLVVLHAYELSDTLLMKYNYFTNKSISIDLYRYKYIYIATHIYRYFVFAGVWNLSFCWSTFLTFNIKKQSKCFSVMSRFSTPKCLVLFDLANLVKASHIPQSIFNKLFTFACLYLRLHLVVKLFWQWFSALSGTRSNRKKNHNGNTSGTRWCHITCRPGKPVWRCPAL